ncbi:MAG: cadmium-translocating P-type ATPase [Oscillospiraceae bacterium]|nr:cadmium-translocating P-type ATPase [Oscillospiraceae bacterium]
MKQYNVTGMSCAACQARVENAVSAVPGVESCAVSLLTNSMGVEGTASEADIIRAVENAGYGASPKGAEKTAAPDESANLAGNETPAIRSRLIASAIVTLALMYFSMGHMMLSLPVPPLFDGNCVALGLIQMVLAAVVMLINRKFFISGFRSATHLAPNMDTLVALGSGVSFLWSLFVLFRMTRLVADGDGMGAMALMDELYFESAAMILTLITVGKLLESISKGRTTDALRSLMKLRPKTATLVRGEKEVEVDISEVQKGDIFAVRPGEAIPVDGVVLEGASAVNESALTGESIPVDKAEGDKLSAGTVNQSGYLRARATRVGEDTTLSQIIKMVSDAAATKAPIAKLADKVSAVFVPGVIGVAVVVTLIWLFISRDVGYALARGISVLVISCPCALGLATPVAIMVGNGLGARNGILFKTAESLEETGKAEIVVLDKTGTVTEGEPRVTDIIPEKGISEAELLSLAYALEAKSEHPLAKAVIAECEKRGIEGREVADFTALPGNGLRAVLGVKALTGGNAKFIGCAQNDSLASEGKTPLYFALDGILIGTIAVADTIKADSPAAIRELKNMGIRTVMLTGDNRLTAEAVGRIAGVDKVVAGVLPEGKEAVIRRLQTAGRVIMVGDGINDAPALTRANIGVAIGAGTDVAIDAADVVLMNSSLSDVPAAIRLSRATRRNIVENLFWAFFYNVICIPLAAGALIPLGITLNPMIGAAAMSLSSFCVVTNALRLNLFRLRNAKGDKKITPAELPELSEEKEENGMEKVIKVEGMMCPMCEKHVREALEKLPGVESAKASHTAGTATINYTSLPDDGAIRKAVEEAGYKVL